MMKTCFNNVLLKCEFSQIYVNAIAFHIYFICLFLSWLYYININMVNLCLYLKCFYVLRCLVKHTVKTKFFRNNILHKRTLFSCKRLISLIMKNVKIFYCN